MPPATLAGVLAAFGPAYLATHALPRGAAKVWRAILACHTPALGGHLETCADCGTTRHLYHACRNRHCPQCQTRTKAAWLAARRREVLPVPYFHLVFTLPHDLNGLVAASPRALFETLFAAAAETIARFAADPRHLGGTPAFTLVLHTWQQDLARHVHVHALVAGGALAESGDWIAPKKGFLFPVRALSRVFRGQFIERLEALHTADRLPAFTGPQWRGLKHRLYAHDWVVYAKETIGGPQAVLDYLGRYTHRVAIGNERLVGINGETVSFRVRRPSGERGRRVVRLAGTEFIDRFLKHVLPSGFKRIRHYGLLAAAKKRDGLAAARRALAVPPPQPAVIESVADFMRRVARIEIATCPHCGGRLHTVAALPPQRRARAPP